MSGRIDGAPSAEDLGSDAEVNLDGCPSIPLIMHMQRVQPVIDAVLEAVTKEIPDVETALIALMGEKGNEERQAQLSSLGSVLTLLQTPEDIGNGEDLELADLANSLNGVRLGGYQASVDRIRGAVRQKFAEDATMAAIIECIGKLHGMSPEEATHENANGNGNNGAPNGVEKRPRLSAKERRQSDFEAGARHGAATNRGKTDERRGRRHGSVPPRRT